MNKIRAKFLLFLIGMAVAAPLGLLGIALVGQFVAYFQQGANPASIFHGNLFIPPEPEQVRWLPIIAYGGSTPSQAQSEEILAGYRDAWDALTRAHLTGDTSDLLTNWAGDAYAQALAAVDPQHHITLVQSGHRLRLTFFSDDGSVVAFDDLDFDLNYTAGSTTTALTASASVVMTLDTGFWRIRTLTLSYQ